jgi:deferrochelatase/peroxidase EfeB
MNSPYHVLCRRAYHPLTTYCSFGFLDSISQPAVQGVDTNLHPGQEPAVRQGIILLGREGDATPRPPWALDGSFLAFRYLSQNVPEFDTFLKENAIPIPDDPSLPKDLGSELLGARLVGRWKSGKWCNFLVAHS